MLIATISEYKVTDVSFQFDLLSIFGVQFTGQSMAASMSDYESRVWKKIPDRRLYE
jgi:hypothetical protein